MLMLNTNAVCVIRLSPVLSVYLCVGVLIYRTAHLPMFAREDHDHMTRGRSKTSPHSF